MTDDPNARLTRIEKLQEQHSRHMSEMRGDYWQLHQAVHGFMIALDQSKQMLTEKLAQLADAQRETEIKMGALVDAQIKAQGEMAELRELLRRFLARGTNGQT